MIGKKVGSTIYVHKDYAHHHVDPSVLASLHRAAAKHGIDWTIMKRDPKTGHTSLIESPDFDMAHEPTVGRSLVLKPIKGGYQASVVNPPADPWVYHHKWSMVGPDYKGFDVDAAKRRSLAYDHHITPDQRRRMGKQSYWNQMVSGFKKKGVLK